MLYPCITFHHLPLIHPRPGLGHIFCIRSRLSFCPLGLNLLSLLLQVLDSGLPYIVLRTSGMEGADEDLGDREGLSCSLTPPHVCRCWTAACPTSC